MARWVATAAAGMLFVVLSIGISALAQQAIREITALNTAKSDNLQWTLAQGEVEFLSFYNELIRVDAGQTLEMASLRRWFDIFYSRMKTLTTGKLYGQLTKGEKMGPAFDHINTFMTETAALMDGDAKALLAAIPDIAIKAAPLRGEIRAISLEGIRIFSKLSDERRESVSVTMLRIAGLTVGLIVLLLFGVFWLTRLYRFGRMQTLETQQTRDRLLAMLKTSLDAVLVVDREGRFIEFNGAASEIFGYTKDEALGRDMTELIFPEHMIEPHLRGMRHHLATGESRLLGSGRVQVEARRKSGQIFPVELSIEKTMSPQGEIFVSYLRDISDRREAEEKLLKARDEALSSEQAKSRFIAVMSHEMRTPLNGLLGSLDLLKSTSLNDKQVQLTDMMKSSGQLLLHHVNDVLDISRLEGGNVANDLTTLDLDALIDEIVESQSALSTTKGLDLRYDRPAPKIGFMITSSIGLRQILLNLVNNAIKFTEKGEVVVAAAIIDDGKRLRLTVKDTGAGILPADQARIFDDFVTLDSSFGRKADGTGLGLGIARRLVQAIGGEIGVDSQPMKGSLFWLEIPYRAATKTPAKTTAPPRQKPLRAMDVLVVEDNQINRFILREMLQGDGHRVTEAHDGLAGLELAAQRKFDIIFMDISMPRLDGIAATVRLRSGNAISHAVPIVALTAHASDEDRALFLASGMNAVLTKPLNRKSMFEVMAKVTKPSKPRKEASVMAQEPLETQLFNASFDDLIDVLGAKKVTDLAKRYLEEGEVNIPRIAPLFELSDHSALQSLVHSFSGSCATFGATGLQAVLAGMESDLKQGRIESARAALPRLGLIWSKTKIAMTDRLAEMTEKPA
jgi:PAS domain S-box-containing protein